MSIIKKIIPTLLIIFIILLSQLSAEEIKNIGKYKDWQSMVINENGGKVCFVQSSPILQAPKSNKRDAKLFVAFRPAEKIINEVSVTGGYEFNNKNSVTATSGKNKFKFDIKEQGFAWIADTKVEFRMISKMKKGSRIMITGYNQKGSQTIDHYSLLGFTKAYNTVKKACS
ncbi:invasion associated locus B family protein [Candidatus Pelagibacter bacterium nBUS_32]|uniref:invasion associated locus B family protein n=1 Tax=Candidatus Pelagibacter bacterium nBUS_32 TaxID=3374192 RepID=UPI003EB9A359